MMRNPALGRGAGFLHYYHRPAQARPGPLPPFGRHMLSGVRPRGRNRSRGAWPRLRSTIEAS